MVGGIWPMSDNLAERLKHFDFYHCIEVAPGVVTPGHQHLLPIQAPIMATLRAQDLRGKRVLDIGCRDGLFSFEAERMGASAVLGIDNDLSLAATEFLIPHFKSSVRMRRENLYWLSVPEGEWYDFVLFAGVLYHLREPFLGLRKIAHAMKPGGVLLLETGMIVSHDGHAMLHCPAPKDSPYEPTSVTFFNHKGLCGALAAAGFEDIQCSALLIGDTLYRSHEEFLSSSNGSWATSTDIITGRGTYTCRRSAKQDEALERYWFGTHNLNSNLDAGRKFLER